MIEIVSRQLCLFAKQAMKLSETTGIINFKFCGLEKLYLFRMEKNFLV